MQDNRSGDIVPIDIRQELKKGTEFGEAVKRAGEAAGIPGQFQGAAFWRGCLIKIGTGMFRVASFGKKMVMLEAQPGTTIVGVPEPKEVLPAPEPTPPPAPRGGFGCPG